MKNDKPEKFIIEKQDMIVIADKLLETHYGKDGKCIPAKISSTSF